MSQYVIGLDGGQSSTVCAVADASGKVLGVGHSGPSNHITEPGGPQRCQKAVHDAITGSLESSGLASEQIEFVACGMTGISPLTIESAGKGVMGRPHLVVSDVITAYYAGTVGHPGAVVIGGTGSAGYGQGLQGNSVHLGGWGYLMGDEGSAYWVAVQSLQAAVLGAEGRGEKTALSQTLPQAMGRKDLKDLHSWVYGEASRDHLAKLSGVVDETAQAGDVVAQKLMARAGGELANLSVAIIEQLGLVQEEAIASFVGGVFRSSRVRESFKEVVLSKAPRAKVQAPPLPPVGGALLLAFREMGWGVDSQVLTNLQESLRAFGVKG